MALTSGDMTAIAQLLDTKLDAKLKAGLAPIKQELRNLRLHVELETDKKIQLLAENYVPAAARFEVTSNKIEMMQSDIDILKKIAEDHSEKLKKLA